MDSNEEPNHTFSLPSIILSIMLWTSRVLVFTQLWNSDMSIIKMLLMIILYFIMEFCIFFKYISKIHSVHSQNNYNKNLSFSKYVVLLNIYQ